MNNNKVHGENLVYASAVLANAISQNLSVDKIARLAAFLVTLSDNLALLAITKAENKTLE